MAGSGKQSPRDRMVGMMYLVLTAMLALQVKNTVLDKFIDIDESLQMSMSESRKDNQKVLNGMKTSIEKRGNKAEDIKVLENAKTVIKETNEVITLIEQFRTEMIEAAGGYDEDGNYLKADEEDAVATLALGAASSKDGRAYALEQKLNEYVAKIAAINPSLDIKKIALEAAEIQRYSEMDGQSNKDFAQLNFEETPMVAALAVLSDLQNKVARVENRALATLSEKVGAKDLIFDEIVAVVAPESRFVTAGTPYKAKIYVAAHSSTAEPEMSASRGRISVGEGGAGDLEFTASAGDYDERGYAKGFWTGSVKISTPKGDTTLQIREEYTIVKPNIKIAAAAPRALYRNCGNDLDIQVPELGVNYNPTFDVSGATIQTSGQRGKVKIVPTGREVSITVKNNGAKIGTEKFRVKSVPKPTIELRTGGRPLDIRNGGMMPRSIQVKAVPDRDFAEFLPNDARYRATKVKVTLARGTKRVKEMTSGATTINISALAAEARVGDRLVIEIEKVERLNYRGNRENVKMGLQIYQYNITR